MAKVFRVWTEHGRVFGPLPSAAGEPAADGTPADRSHREFGEGRYLLETRLGGGTASDVFRAQDRLLRRPVAVKLYRPDAGSSAERRFREDARQLAWLEHPNLVTLYDAGIELGRPFLVLQFVDGLTLERRLAEGPLSVEQTVTVGFRLADVLTYVHGRGVVHRDIKPASVLVDERDVYLSDFGISRMLGGAHLGAGGLAQSTSAYLAPEQLRGEEAGPAADIYSLGLVLLECLTGEVQYPGSALATAVARLTRRPRIPEGLPEPLRDAIEAMTADDPGARPSAEECRAAFALCEPVVGSNVTFETLDGEATGGRHAAAKDAGLGEDANRGDNVYCFDTAGRRRRARRGAEEPASQAEHSEHAAPVADENQPEPDESDTLRLAIIEMPDDGPAAVPPAAAVDSQTIALTVVAAARKAAGAAKRTASAARRAGRGAGGAHAEQTPAWARPRVSVTTGWVKVAAAGITAVALATVLVRMNTTTVSVVRPADGGLPTSAPYADTPPPAAAIDPDRSGQARSGEERSGQAAPPPAAGPSAARPAAPDKPVSRVPAEPPAAGGNTGPSTRPPAANVPAAPPAADVPAAPPAADVPAAPPAAPPAQAPAEERQDVSLADLLAGQTAGLTGGVEDAVEPPATTCDLVTALKERRAAARERRQQLLAQLFGLPSGPADAEDAAETAATGDAACVSPLFLF